MEKKTFKTSYFTRWSVWKRKRSQSSLKETFLIRAACGPNHKVRSLVVQRKLGWDLGNEHLLKIKFYFYVYSVLHLCTTFVRGAYGDQKRASDLIELDVGAGNCPFKQQPVILTTKPSLYAMGMNIHPEPPLCSVPVPSFTFQFEATTGVLSLFEVHLARLWLALKCRPVVAHFQWSPLLAWC